MPAPTITPLPTPPSRGDSPETFNAEADAFLGALPTLQTEVNAVATWMDTTAAQVDADKTAAAASATAAAASAVDATNNGAAQVALATTQATNAASSAAAAAATAATVGALSSQSIKFPDAALQVAGQFGVLKQSRTNMPAIMNAADSHVIMMWETPQEKNGQNAGFRLFGNSITGTNNLQFYCLMNGSSTNDSGGNAGKLSWHHRNSGVSLNLVGPEIPVTVDRWVGKVSRTVVGADTLYTFDAWNTTDGTKYTGTTQTNPAGVVGIAAGTLSQTHWYIGHADTVAAEPTINTALTLPNSGASDMGIEFLGFYNGAITDTNMQNIALGADPLVELTAANFGYYRRFRGTDSASLAPVAGTGDTTPATTVLGSVNPGGNLRRQGLTNYLTLDRKVDGFVHGCRKGELGQQVYFSGSLAGVAYSGCIYVRQMPDWGFREVRHLNGYVWGRVVLRDGSAWVPWTKLARLVNSATEGLTFVERSRFAVGVKVAVLGQSQVEYALGSAGVVGRALNRTITGGPGGSIIGKRWDNVAYPIYNQVRVFDGNVTWSDAGAAMIDTLSGAFGCPVCIVNLGQSGTDSREWIKTAGTRLWSDSVATMALAGNDISCLVWQWYTNMASVGAAFGSTILDATVYGKGASADTNWIGNGLFRQGFALGISGYTRTSATTAGPFDTDQNTAAGIAESRLAARTWAASNGVAYGPEIIDMQIDSAGGPHEAGTVYGTVRMGLRMAECAMRALGASSLSDGAIGSPVFNGGKTTITLTATLPNIGGLRVDDTATYAANVQGFEISTNGGTTWSRSGFTAALGATPATRNQVVLTKTTGDWTAVAAGQMRVRYAWGGPLAYGTSLESSLLIRGLLYDGCDREGGLGFPIQPMASTVVS